ncbi:hypothetical protein [Carboxylicivirga sp. RSCT41]|uniref:hypothetical protein n=1 Tax=Carboxylicivirga agarovorans TaxID=3417570 RepID=UPI003D3504DB
MNYKLKLTNDISLDELKLKVDAGYRFKVFQYCFSPIFATYFPFSPAFLLKDDEQGKQYMKKYIWLSSLFGWWGLYGPLYTLKAIKLNAKGGLDVTDDIMLNITEEDLLNNCVQLAQTTIVFRKPERSDIKTMSKLVRDYTYDNNLKECYAAWSLEYDNVFCVGLKTEKDFQKYADVFQQHLSKKFYKHIQIDLIDLNDRNELTEQMRKQGATVIER